VRVRSTDHVTLAVHHLGGKGEPLLVAHATGFCGHAYRPLAAALHPHFDVWALDFRGHGDSTRPRNGDFSWDAMAADALTAIEAVRNGPLVAVGHSMGGAALLLAELSRPGVLRSAYLYEPIVFPPGYVHAGPSPMATSARRRRRSFPSKAEALSRYASRPPLGTLRADALAAYVDHGFADRADGTVELKCTPEDEAATFASENKMSVERLAGLTLPTVVAVGGRTGEPNPAAFGPPIVAAMPRARLAEYPHLGHFGPLQDPDTVAEDVLAHAGAPAPG
jgi:pimeloyl-ACP methyl ester carboxylesterase